MWGVNEAVSASFKLCHNIIVRIRLSLAALSSVVLWIMQMGTCSIIGTKTNINIMEFTVLLELMEEFNLYIHRDIYIYVMYIIAVLHNVYLMLTDALFCKFLVLSC